MTDPDAPQLRRGGRPRRRGRSAVVGPLLLVALLATVPFLPAAPSGARPAQVSSDGTLPTSTTVAPDGTGAPTAATPTGAVAYVTAAGDVLVGQGAATPVRMGGGAALGPDRVGAVALSPDGARVAWVTGQGAVVVRDVEGGAPSVVASDAVTTVVGRAPVLAWNGTGEQVAYVAVGTRDMVAPRRTDGGVSTEGAFPAPLPPGDQLGNVVKVVDRAGRAVGRVGDPSERSVVGLTWSAATDLLLLQTQVPGTSRRYTLSIATTGTSEVTPTLFSADDPMFSPDGRFLVGVGPSKGQQELLRVSTETLERTTLATSARICSPAVSPDGTRVVFGAGPRCSRIGLVAAAGGPVVDATPDRLPADVTFGPGSFGWTAEGRYLTHPLCRRSGGCGAAGSLFLDPDTGRRVEGTRATTVVPALRALAQDLVVDVEVSGPIRFSGTFPVDASQQAALTATTAADGRLEASLVAGDRAAAIEVQGREDSPFVTGRLTVADPATGVDRTLFVLGRANVRGVQVFSISGVWISTDDLPFASGKFSWAVRRD